VHVPHGRLDARVAGELLDREHRDVSGSEPARAAASTSRRYRHAGSRWVNCFEPPWCQDWLLGTTRSDGGGPHVATAVTTPSSDRALAAATADASCRDDLSRLAEEFAALSPGERARMLAVAARRERRPRLQQVLPPVPKGGTRKGRRRPAAGDAPRGGWPQNRLRSIRTSWSRRRWMPARSGPELLRVACRPARPTRHRRPRPRGARRSR
jgi:hypothetical protein